MLGLIKILNDSVVLYQNWIHESEWEHIYSFPHGGLTFKIANDNIKFFATHDYFYRNLICSFDLPVHIIDELNDIDGDYSDEEEIAEILNRIYPLEQTSGVDLRLYLKKSEAEELYYDKDEIDDKLDDKADKDDVYTKEETDAILDGIYTKQETDLLLDQKADADDVYTKSEVDNKLQNKANKDDVYTKAEADAKYQPKGDYVSATTLDNYYTKAQSDAKYLTEHQPIKTINHQSLIGTGNIDISGGSITVDSALSTTSTNPVQNKVITNALRTISGNTYTKTEADAKFISQIKTINNQSLIGTGNIDIGSGGTIDVDDTLSSSSTNPVQNRVITNALKTVSGNTYTKTEADNKFLTEHQPLKTINNQSLIGTGNIDIGSGGTIDVDAYLSPTSINPVENRAIYAKFVEMEALINTLLSNYYTKEESDNRYYKKEDAPFTLTVNTNIAATITINGSTYSNTMSASKQLSSGASYTVSFSEVSGYNKPANMTGTMTASKTLTGTYTATTGNVKARLTLNNDSVVEIPGSGALSSGETKAYSATCVSTEITTACTSLGGHAFADFSSLATVTIPNSVTNIGRFAFSDCTSLVSAPIPSSIKTIPWYCFVNCGFAEYTIPNGVTTIDKSAFERCYNMTAATISDSVKTIGEQAFYYCTGLTSVTIGSGVTSISRNAFTFCRSLTSITLNATTPPTLGNDVFVSTNNCPIYVPAASVNAYKTAENWSNYASRIQAIP